MIPDVNAVYRFRVQRITDTVEDALVLLELRTPVIYAKHELASAAIVIRSASEETRSAVYSEPVVAMWSLVDLSPLMETPDTCSAIELAETLATQLRYIAVAMSVRDGLSYSTALSAVTHLPGIGVATGLAADETQMVNIEVHPRSGLLINGRHSAQHQHRALSDFTIPHGDATLAAPVLDGYEPELIDDAAIARWSDLLAKVRPLVMQCDAAASLVKAFGCYLSPLRSSSNGNHLSVSFKHRPGVIYLSWSADYLEVAEAIVHESDHQCLYEVINEDPLFDDAPINFQPVFRSPWRQDPRPLSGLFFGFSAFVTVGLFWQSISSKQSEPLWTAAGCRAVLALDQALDAIAVTRHHASLTEKGSSLLAANETCAQETLSKLEASKGFSSWRAKSRERRAADSLAWQQTHRGVDVVAG